MLLQGDLDLSRPLEVPGSRCRRCLISASQL